jgi:tetratricopeptide (TPR) repeat protein
MADDRQGVIDALTKQLAATPKVSRPYEHATLAYRLGLAHAETAGANPTEGLRRALAFYDVAAGIFDPRFDPVHHARVLNAAGAAHRSLGNRQKAAELWEKAVGLLEAEGTDNERAAVYNNLGLARTEMADPSGAVEAFDKAVELFDTTEAEGRRGQVAALHNRSQAHASMGTDEGLELALADLEEARAAIDVEEAPLHHAMVEHSVGVTCSALASRRPEERRSFYTEAVRAFDESLRVFTRTDFPFQHALAKHNLGLAYAGLEGTANLRRALASFEDSLGVLDPRLQADAWRQVYASLERVEKSLADVAPGASRTDHFAALVAVVSDEEREALMKERLLRYFVLPEKQLMTALAELAMAVAKLGHERAYPVLETELLVVMEQPKEFHAVTLQAIHEAHRRIDDEEQRTQADQALDQAIGGLGGVQRIHVRDYLYSIGWERP